MIPKIIHYCWFGGNDFPEKLRKCIDSWSIYMPDYKIVCWSEKNIDLNINTYIKQAYEAKKWAFVADFVRLYALYNYGGIYFDTDVEVFKSFDNLLGHRLILGTEVININNRHFINVDSAVFASEKRHPYIGKCLESYNSSNFRINKFEYDLTVIQVRMTKILEQYYNYQKIDKLQNLNDGIIVYPTEYFTNITFPKKNVYSLHRITHSWNDDGGRVYKLARKYNLMVIYYVYKKIKKWIIK